MGNYGQFSENSTADKRSSFDSQFHSNKDDLLVLTRCKQEDPTLKKRNLKDCCDLQLQPDQDQPKLVSKKIKTEVIDVSNESSEKSGSYHVKIQFFLFYFTYKLISYDFTIRLKTSAVISLAK